MHKNSEVVSASQSWTQQIVQLQEEGAEQEKVYHVGSLSHLSVRLVSWDRMGEETASQVRFCVCLGA
jgi:hypothetical protein